MDHGRARPLTAAQQHAGLANNPACPGMGSVRMGRLCWKYASVPTPLSREYGIRIVHATGKVPVTYVDSPDLVALGGGRRIPHVYSEVPLRLCLFRPGRGDWAPHMPLDRTVVPWTALWLFFFEEWLASGVWKGGGEHVRSPAEAAYLGDRDHG